MIDELSFRCWQIALQLKLFKFAKKISFLALEFIQLSFLPSEIYAKSVPVSLILFFCCSRQTLFFFLKALTKGVRPSEEWNLLRLK